MLCKACNRKEHAAPSADHHSMDIRKFCNRPTVTAQRKSQLLCKNRGVACHASMTAPSKPDEVAMRTEDGTLSSWAQDLHSRIAAKCSQSLDRVEPDMLSGAGVVVVLALWFSVIVTSNVLPGVLLLGVLVAWGAAVDPPHVDPPPPAAWPAAAALLGAAALTWWNLMHRKWSTTSAHVRGLGAELKPTRLLTTLLKRGGLQRKLEAEQVKDLTAQLQEMQQLAASLEEREAKLQEMLRCERLHAEEHLKQKDVELGELRMKLESTHLQLEGIEKVHEQELVALKTDIRIKEQQLQSLVKSSGQQSELLLKLEAQAAANAKLRGTMNTFEKQMVMVRTSLKDAKLKQVKAELLNTTYENQIKDLQQEVARLKRERAVLVEQMQDLYKHSTGLVKAYSNGTSR